MGMNCSANAVEILHKFPSSCLGTFLLPSECYTLYQLYQPVHAWRSFVKVYLIIIWYVISKTCPQFTEFDRFGSKHNHSRVDLAYIFSKPSQGECNKLTRAQASMARNIYARGRKGC